MAKMMRADGTTIEVAPENVDQAKASGLTFAPITEPLTPPSTAPTIPTSDVNINDIFPAPAVAPTPRGVPMPASDTDRAREQQQQEIAASPVQPTTMGTSPGELTLTNRQVQETGYKAVDEAKIRAQQEAALAAEKKKNEASTAYDGALKSLQITNAEEYDKAKAETDAIQKDMSDRELEAQTKFMTEYKAALDKFNASPVPEKKGWWEITSTGDKVAAGLATVLASVAYARSGDMSAVKGVVNSIDARVNDDLEAQKARYLAERDMLVQRRELNDIRAKNFRDSLAAIEAKRNIVLDQIKRKGEMAIAKSPALDEAQKAKNTAELSAIIEAKKLSNLMETAKKVTTGDSFAPPKGGGGDLLETETKRLDYIAKAKTSLGLNTPSSPMARHLTMKEAQQRLTAIESATDPEMRRALSIELGNFIAETMNQGSFTVNMTGTIFPKSAIQDAKSWLQYVAGTPQGHVTDEQVKSMRVFLDNQLSTSGAKARDTDLLKMAESLERVGIDRSELGVAFPSASKQDLPSLSKPLNKPAK